MDLAFHICYGLLALSLYYLIWLAFKLRKHAGSILSLKDRLSQLPLVTAQW